MAKPVLYPISAFDKVNTYDFTFSWQGFQAFKNKLIIKNNTTNIVVYEQIQTSMQLKHILPENTLMNGVLYNAQVQTFDKNNNPTPV